MCCFKVPVVLVRKKFGGSSIFVLTISDMYMYYLNCAALNSKSGSVVGARLTPHEPIRAVYTQAFDIAK